MDVLSIMVLSGYNASIILGVTTILLLLRRFVFLRLDPREPPLIKPTIPYLGHIIGLVTSPHLYLRTISKRPIYTLPVMGRKLYVVTDASLMQSVFRSKTLTTEPFMGEFGQKVLDLDDEVMAQLKAIPDNPNDPSYLRDTFHETAISGPELYKMNSRALTTVALWIKDIGDVLQIENLFDWLRFNMSMATSIALLGSHSPTIADPSLLNALSDFDDATIGLLFRIFPSFIGWSGFKGRDAWKSALRRYYNAQYDLEPDVAQIIKGRANVAKKYGISLNHIGDIELEVIRASTTSAIPTLYWTLVYIASDSILTEEIRQELQAFIKTSPKCHNGKREISIDITKFDVCCPLLVSAYREATRLVNAQFAARRVWRDTVISDGDKEYLLTYGADIIMPSGAIHLSTDIWGPNAHEFDARRFMTKVNANEAEKNADKARKKAYFPFGGGKHLCPGRNFAFAEILGTISILLLGFEVKNKNGGPIQVPDLMTARIGEAVGRPRANNGNLNARIERRAEWDGVTWRFVCGD